MITYRLADSLPAGLAQKLLLAAKERKANAEFRKTIENYLDAGHGKCWLRQDSIARIVRDAWLHFDQDRYLLHAWVIMPNHVHILAEEIPPHSLPEIIKTWKSYSARQINKILGRTGPLWQREYWDRYIRNRAHYESAAAYIYENPVTAGLVERVEDWRWCSWNDSDAEKAKRRRPV